MQSSLRFDELPPLRDYQIEGAHWLVEHPTALLADEMGLGKTVTAIVAACIAGSERPLKFLVVCPKVLRYNWEYEISRWAYGKTEFIVTHYEALRKGVPEGVNAVIVDEAHYIKNLKAQRSKDVHTLAQSTEIAWFLTGTPLEKPRDLWHLLQLTAPHEFDKAGKLHGKHVEAGKGAGYWPFVQRYCNPQKVRHGRGVNDYHWDLDGAENLDELRERMRVCTLRRTKESVGAQLPEKQRHLVMLEGGKKSSFDWLDSSESLNEMLSALKARLDLTEWAKMWHAQGLAKSLATLQFIENLHEIDDQKNIIVFARHKDVLEFYKNHLGGCYLHAGLSVEERGALVEYFQRSKGVILVSSIEIGSVGLTLTSADTMVFAELTPSATQIIQAEDRIHRIGQRNNVNIYYPVTLGSIDYHLAKLIVRKAQVTDTVLRCEVAK